MKKFSEFLDDPKNRLILWILTGIIIFLVGILSPKADSLFNNNTIHFYNNNGSSYNDVGTSYIDQTGESWSTLTTVAGSYGGLVAIQLSSPLIQGHIYTLYLNVGAESNGGQTRLSAKNCLGLGGSPGSANNSYVNCEITPSFSDYSTSTGDKSRGVYYTFIANKNGIVLSVPYTSQYTCSSCRNYSYGYTIQDNGDSNNLTQDQINNIINNQSNSINNNTINVVTNSEQNIINNQNENQEKTNELLGNCHKNLINLNNVNTSDSNSGYRYPVSLTAGKTYTIISYDNLFNFKIGESRWSHTDNEGNSSSQRYTFTYTPNSNNSSHYLMVYYQQPPGANLSTHQLVLVEGNYNGPFINYNEQSCSSKLDDTNQAINDVNNSLNDDDTTGATDKASDFFSSFSTNTFGLTSIITAPLNLIQSLTSSTCSALHIPLPFLDNKYIDLPCMTSIYQSAFGSFFTMYQTVTFGIIAYWVCVRIFNQIKDFKNPEHDEIEVLDL